MNLPQLDKTLVEGKNFSVVGNHQDPVNGCFGLRLKETLLKMEFGFRPLSLGDIRGDASQADGPAFAILNDHRVRFDPYRAASLSHPAKLHGGAGAATKT